MHIAKLEADNQTEIVQICSWQPPLAQRTCPNQSARPKASRIELDAGVRTLFCMQLAIILITYQFLPVTRVCFPSSDRSSVISPCRQVNESASPLEPS
jgi:hypothetical protein